MKSSSSSQRVLMAVTMAVATLLLPRLGHAQSLTTQTWDGGSGTWDQGSTPNWNNGAQTWNGGYDDADFTKTPGTVTVSDSGAGGPVTFDQLVFGPGTGDWVVTGDTLMKDPFINRNENVTLVNVEAGAGNVTISSQLDISDVGQDHATYISNSSNSTLTIGSLSILPYQINTSDTNGRAIEFNQTAGSTGTIVLNGTYTTAAGALAALAFGSNGNAAANYYIASSANLAGFNSTGNPISIGSGSVHLDNSTLTSSQTIFFGGSSNSGIIPTLDVVGAKALVVNAYATLKYPQGSYSMAAINQSTADASTWAGQIDMDGTSYALGAVADGRLTVTGQIVNSGPLGLIKTGAGTVVLASGTGNSYSLNDGTGLPYVGTVAADLQAGTTLITNTGASAFGNNTGVVKLEAGATLGGTGFSSQQVVAEGATSVITAGDFGQANLGIAPSFGQLNLTGGLAATSGLTLDFKLDGAYDNDVISLGTSGALTLNGTVTVNFSSVDGSVVTGYVYTLMTGSGSWAGSAPTFDFTAPAGYVLDKSYYGTGYDFNNGDDTDPNFGTSADTLTVEFALAPEPSTYGMLGLGLLALVAVGRFRRLNA
jgi:hypothetical protein